MDGVMLGGADVLSLDPYRLRAGTTDRAERLVAWLRQRLAWVAAARPDLVIVALCGYLAGVGERAATVAALAAVRPPGVPGAAGPPVWGNGFPPVYGRSSTA
jgi:hypothetical protein